MKSDKGFFGATFDFKAIRGANRLQKEKAKRATHGRGKVLGQG